MKCNKNMKKMDLKQNPNKERVTKKIIFTSKVIQWYEMTLTIINCNYQKWYKIYFL